MWWQVAIVVLSESDERIWGLRSIGEGLQYWEYGVAMTPNGDTISVFQNDDGSVPGEGVGPVALLEFLYKHVWDN